MESPSLLTRASRSTRHNARRFRQFRQKQRHHRITLAIGWFCVLLCSACVGGIVTSRDRTAYAAQATPSVIARPDSLPDPALEGGAVREKVRVSDFERVLSLPGAVAIERDIRDADGHLRKTIIGWRAPDPDRASVQSSPAATAVPTSTSQTTNQDQQLPSTPKSIGQIQGTVHDTTGHPIGGIRVRVLNAQTSAEITSVYASEDGRFRVPGITAAEKYIVVAGGKSFSTAGRKNYEDEYFTYNTGFSSSKDRLKATVIDVHANETTTDVALVLHQMDVIPPSGTDPLTNVTVTANPLWTQTPITVQAGDVITGSATGQWCVGVSLCSGPDGLSTVLGSDLWVSNSGQGSLIAYSGNSPYTDTVGANYVGLGSTFTVVAQNTGVLYLGFNDDKISGGISDNSGRVFVDLLINGVPLQSASMLLGGQTCNCENNHTDYRSGYALTGDPVNTATGNLTETITDLAIQSVGPHLSAQRTYNSQAGTSGMFGTNWTSNLDSTLRQDGGGYIGVRLANGAELPYTTTSSVTSIKVYGQTSFTTNTVNTGGLRATSLNQPSSTAVDSAGGVYVADTQNNRVLYYPVGSTIASRVYGQPNMTTNTVNTGGVSATSLNSPSGVAVNPTGTLYVADTGNNRILSYLSASTIASQVLGQPNFSSNTANNGGVSASSVSGPRGLSFDPLFYDLYVADTVNNRVLVFSSATFSSLNTTAGKVYGQPSYTSNIANNGGISGGCLNAPQGVFVSGNRKVYIADTGNNRVLYYDTSNTTTSFIYGQANAISNSPNRGGSVNATTLSSPVSVNRDPSGQIYVSDQGNNRILVYPSDPGQRTARQTYGQGSFTSSAFNTSGLNATGLGNPAGVSVSGDGSLYVADSGNNRLLRYPPNRQVYGQPGYTTNTPNNGKLNGSSVNAPAGTAIDRSSSAYSGGLYLADQSNNRVLYFPPNSQSATRVYGQPNLTTNLQNNGGIGATSLNNPTDVAVDTSGNLYIVDSGNNRVLFYIAGGTTASRVYGQSSFTTVTSNANGISATTLNTPFGIGLDSNNNVYISDQGNNRVLYYDTATTPSVNPAASRVYGQNGSSTTNTANTGGISANSLNTPVGVTVVSGGIYIADQNNNRVLYYSGTATTASSVYGQNGSFTTNTQNTGGIGAATLAGPSDVAVTSAGNVYINDTYNNRVLYYNGTSTTANQVYGQSSFTGSSSSAAGFNRPMSLVLDTSNRLYVAEPDYNRVQYFGNGVSLGASQIYGQPTLNSIAPNSGAVGANTLVSPTATAIDQAGGVYTVDSGNSRVLYYASGSTVASRVYGQPNFTTTGYNTGGVSATSLGGPNSVAVAGNGDVYIADTSNNRVLRYPAGSTTANRVYGQNGSFTANSPNYSSVSAATLAGPTGVGVDQLDNVYILDGNNRILYYPAGSTTATRVYGQPNFTTVTANTGGVSATSLSSPWGLSVDNTGNVYVADTYNNRVLYYPTGSTTATRVYGQPSFTTNAANQGNVSPSATTLKQPFGVAVDLNGVYVADTNNNRVLYYPNTQTVASQVLGQPSFALGYCDTTAQSFCTPFGVTTTADGSIYVADANNNRVLRYAQTRVNYAPPPGAVMQLSDNGDGTFSLFHPGQTVDVYAASTGSIAGKLQKQIDPQGQKLTYTYNSNSITVSDDFGRSVVYSLDASSRVTAVNFTDPVTSFVHQASYVYDTGDSADPDLACHSGELCKVTDVDGYVWRYGYDSAHHMIGMQDGRGNKTLTRYYTDSSKFYFGWVYQQFDQNYTANQIIPAPNPLYKANTTTYTYDNAQSGYALVTTATDGRGVQTQFSYISGPVLVKRVDNASGLLGASALSTQTAYDANYNLRVVSRPASVGGSIRAVTNRVYDSLGNVLSGTDALGNPSSVTYDSRNNPLRQTSSTGSSTTTTYTALNMPLVMTRPDGITITNTYGDSGHPGWLTQSVSSNGLATNYQYDGRGNPQKITRSFNTLKLGSPNPAPVSYITEYVYDGLGRLTDQYDTYDTTRPGGLVKLHYVYDKRGNQTQITNQLGQTATNTYDGAANLTKSVNFVGQVSCTDYDPRNKRTQSRVKLSTSTSCAPSDTNNLLVTSYGYDEVSNSTMTTDPRNIATTNTYDGLNRLIKTTVPLQAGGVMQTDQSYDGANNLASMTRVNTGNGGSGNQLTQYVYDDIGRITQTVYPDGSRSSTTYTDTPNTTGPVVVVKHTLGFDSNFGNAITTTWQYDLLYRPVKATVNAYAGLTNIAKDLETQYDYNPASNQSTVSNPYGIVTTSQTDAAGQALSLTRAPANPANGATAQTSYSYLDPNGLPIRTIDSIGNWTDTGYDPSHRPTSSDPLYGG